MERLNFYEIKKLINKLYKMDAALSAILMSEQKLQEKIQGLCKEILLEDALRSLGGISVDELKRSKAGIRTTVLKEAGYTDLYKLSQAADSELALIPGIGEKQIEAVRSIIAEFINKLSSYSVIRFSVDDNNSVQKELLSAVYEYRKSAAIIRDAEGVYAEFHDFTEMLRNDHIILNRFRWVFSGRELKDHTAFVVAEMASFCKKPVFERADRLIRLHREVSVYDEGNVLSDYENNSADYYSIIEKFGGSVGDRKLAYGSIPSQLAQEIDSCELVQTGFKGTLRTYQAFGARYILNQSKVLLGDEMGLGKTIQAIAAISHIALTKEKSYFLVICPASVLVNWCREIKKFSSIPTYLVHGAFAEDAFNRWCGSGGAAVTNYEMMGRITDRIDEHMKLDMLIVDEAHYIKNPDAKRSSLIRRLDNESDRILLMTGTPLENRVEEMCSLIDFIRPDMSYEIRRIANLSSAPQFKEIIAPFYLRRTRDQVLKELPEIEDEQEWCLMTDTDRLLYIQAVESRDFNEMRRVSFMQNEAALSSKAVRLLELCDQAADEDRKVVVYSYFRESIALAADIIGDKCAGIITGSTSVAERQDIIDRFADTQGGSVLICQIQAGGIGLNIQTASIVIFLEPQIKPSLESQAVSRVYRMGQVRNVLVYHLLCEDTIDEAMVTRLAEKQEVFDLYADESAMADAWDNLIDREWIGNFIENERRKYLPMVI